MTATAGGWTGATLWWSVTITSTPSSFARVISFSLKLPQSTVMISVAPAAAIFSTASTVIAIPFDKTVRYKCVHMFKLKGVKGIEQHGRCSQAVDIIIAVNRNMFLFFMCLYEPRDRRLSCRATKMDRASSHILVTKMLHVSLGQPDLVQLRYVRRDPYLTRLDISGTFGPCRLVLLGFDYDTL